MNILAFDTSTAACSVALSYDDLIINEHIIQPRGHANLILSMIESLLGTAGITLSDISIISFGQGPGSFTGLRIAAGVCQGISYSQNIPVIALSSLRILAQGAYRETQQKNIAILQDARMSEIYWGCYSLINNSDSNHIMQLIGVENVSKPEMIQLDSTKSWYCIGEALLAYQTKLKLSDNIINKEFNYPNAIDMIALTKFEFEKNNCIKAKEVNPVYLRNQVASKKIIL
ncbi:MAG: tRNA (adenosine(37)-N6)-threonylcarbamoyltransferase complex dimerization subunit type 1 TsaB [Thiohalomonadales bacterium]